MADIHLRAVTSENFRECVHLQVSEAQAGFVATNALSLAQAGANPALVPLGVYDGAARGYPKTAAPMVGFVMIGTSHRQGNTVVPRLFESVGFVPWAVDGAEERSPGEVYLQLPRSAATLAGDGHT